MLWNEDERLCREEKMIHRKTICNITFNSDGSRMITCDIVSYCILIYIYINSITSIHIFTFVKSGTVGVWRTQRGLTPICSLNKAGAMRNVIFSGLSFE